MQTSKQTPPEQPDSSAHLQHSDLSARGEAFNRSVSSAEQHSTCCSPAPTPGLQAPRAVFWDMDGTLVDSEPLWEIATAELSSRLGKPLIPEVRAKTVGQAFRNTCRIIAEYCDVEATDALIEEQYQITVARMLELFAAHLEPMPGVRNILDGLHAAGIPMMVTTNTPREIAQGAIDAVGAHYFVATLCGDEVSKGKPDPEMYATAARTVGVHPQDCLVFEDSATGMAAAAGAGCRLVGLPADSSVPVPPGAHVIGAGETAWIGLDLDTIYSWFRDMEE